MRACFPSFVIALPLLAFAAGAAGAIAVQDFDLAKRRAEHWAWRAIRAQPPPPVSRADWVRDPIDQFVLARLAQAGLDPADPADPATWIRRLSLDLIGLPPTPEQVADILADPSPDARARIVDQLLASPRFGERWARHWLDLVRYAETRGHEFDHAIPNAFQYRDYVIRALNADVPYDQFVTEHVAGDLMNPARLHAVEGFNESILGTGFWALGEEVHSPVDIRGDESDRIDNKIDVFSKTFLSITVSCARCHDHKFDAISARDYYALAGFVLSSSYRQVPFDSIEQDGRVARELESLRAHSRASILSAVARSWTATVDRLDDYLMAARKLSTAEPAGAARFDGQLQEVAAAFGIDAARLGRWVGHLRQARQEPMDPFQPWSRLGLDPGRDPQRRPGAMIEPMLDEARRRTEEFERAIANGRVIIDYRRAGDVQWISDGYAFGTRPARAGDVQFGSDPRRPIEAIYYWAAARTDRLWRPPQIKTGVEREPGKVAWPQSGRMLRTPTFSLKTGRLYYLVQGSGHAYAAVASHRLIAGPLHGALVRSWDAPDDAALRWVEHDLSVYKGHRAHVEFSPRTAAEQPASDLAIVMVVESDAPPPLLAADAVPLLEQLAAAESIESMADAYKRCFRRVLDAVRSDALAERPDAAGLAWLADWMVRHSDLFGDDVGGMVRPAVEAEQFLERVTELQRRMGRESRVAPALLDGSAVDEFLLTRGNHRTPAEPVERRFLEALDGLSEPIDEPGSGRLRLAASLTDSSNPLVARAIVNRVWLHLFGRGLVESVDNFGALGEPPTHPELLDHLADRFMRQRWSMKQLIRDLVLSSTYGMSSVAAAPDVAGRQDPRNVLLHRMPVRRLEAEIIRDSILAVSGRLDAALYGPSVEVHLTPFMEGRGRPASSGPLDGAGRRSVYVRTRRNFPHPMLAAFDVPTPFSTVGRRSVSNVPAQALALMNSPFLVEQAGLWAQRIAADTESSVPDRVARMYLAAFARDATADELAESVAFLEAQQRDYEREPELRAWADLAHVLFNVKEFIFVR